jgi:hypothetical protein
VAAGAVRAVAGRCTGAQTDTWRVEPSRRGAPGVKAGTTGGGGPPVAAELAAGGTGDRNATALTATAVTAAASVTPAPAAFRRVRRAGISR